MRKIFFILCAVIVFLFLSARVSIADGDAQNKNTFGQRIKSFIQRLLSYPANVIQGSVEVVADTASRSAEVVTKEVVAVGEVITGDTDKIKDIITEPLTGTAETVVKAVEETISIPAEAAKE